MACNTFSQSSWYVIAGLDPVDERVSEHMASKIQIF